MFTVEGFESGQSEVWCTTEFMRLDNCTTLLGIPRKQHLYFLNKNFSVPFALEPCEEEWKEGYKACYGTESTAGLGVSPSPNKCFSLTAHQRQRLHSYLWQKLTVSTAAIMRSFMRSHRLSISKSLRARRHSRKVPSDSDWVLVPTAAFILSSAIVAYFFDIL